MDYYSIAVSLNRKIVGDYAQANEAIYSCNVWDEPQFIDHESVSFKKNDFEPITAKAILVKKAKPTDLISADMIGFTKKLLVSEKLKSILMDARQDGLQFHKSPVIYKGIELNDYWVINPYIFNHELIDFSRTTVFIRQSSKMREQLSVSNCQEFVLEKERIESMGYPYTIFIERPQILDDTKMNFFVIDNVEGGIKYVVSGYLKGVIEDAIISGIEFQPITLTLNEWLKEGGPREKIYGKSW